MLFIVNIDNFKNDHAKLVNGINSIQLIIIYTFNIIIDQTVSIKLINFIKLDNIIFDYCTTI